MSRKENDESQQEQLQRLLSEWHRQMEAGTLSKAVARLLAEVAALNATIASDDEADREMLSLALSEALKGTDLSKRFPEFYIRLLADPALRQDFLDGLVLLEGEENGTLEPLPAPASRDLSFLQQVQPPVAQVKTTETGWRATWRRTQADLQRLFSLSYFSPEPGMRGDVSGEEHFLALVNDEIVVDDRRLRVLLEAIRTLEKPDRLEVTLFVAMPESDAGTLQGTLQWGPYEETVSLSARGQANFADVPVRMISDAEGNVVAAELHLHYSAV